MIASRFEPASFFQRSDNVALRVAASELFGWLNRSLDLPPQWAAMVGRRTGAQDVVRAGGTVDGSDAEDVLFIRVTPVDVTVEEPAILSRDGFSCKADVRLRISAIADRSELSSFAKMVLGSRRVAQAGSLATFLQSAVASTLSKLAGERDAGELVDARVHDDIASSLTDALKGPCFSAGLVLERMPSVRFDSPAFQHVREVEQRAAATKAEHEAGREVDEALAQARSEHLNHLSGLLGRLKELAAASPEMALPELIRTFTESQRGEIYQALFAAETPTARTQWVVVAAGNELLFFNPCEGDAPSRRLKVEGPAGPVRSIQTAHDPELGMVLLLGAATGVYRWPIDRAAADLTLLVPGSPEVRGGFNSAAVIGDRLLAAHSELGLWDWNVRNPSPPARRFESFTKDAVVIRCVRAFGPDVYVAMDDRVIRFQPQDTFDQPTHVYTGSLATITALCPTDDGLLAGNADGDVLHWKRGSFTEPELLHRGMNRPAESVGVIAAHGVTRLVFADTTPRVHTMVFGDSFKCDYEAGGQTLRRVAIAPDLLVATNDLRDRLFCWQPGKPREPHATIAVSRLCSHSIQDVCLVPVPS